MNKIFTLLTFSLILSSCSIFGIMSEKEPNNKIILKTDDYEVREYSSFIVAETRVSGNMDEIKKTAFNRLFKYITGNNVSSASIKMTTPVTSTVSQSEEIKMTAPVIMEESKINNHSTMAFTMPAKYTTLEMLPTPKDETVTLRKVEAKKVFVHAFSGLLDQENVEENIQIALSKIAQTDLKVNSKPRVAGYNPPWTLPALRRNEILIDVE